MVLSILAIVLLSGGLSFPAVVGAQGGGPGKWFLFHNPFSFIAFFVFFIGMLAEANRAPFDLPEAESELVSGYHTEYTGMRFAFFALAEYIEVFILCGVAASLFLGGHNVPFGLGKEDLFIQKFKWSPLVAVALSQALQLAVFFFKTFTLFYIVIWIRWTLPRLRVDQLMTLCWKYLTPIALFNLVGISFWIVLFHGEFLVDLVFSSNVSQGSGH